jgi:hypothetical protein
MPAPSLKLVSISPFILECSECPSQFNAARGGEVLIADIVRHILDRHPKATSKLGSDSASEAGSSLLYDIRTKRSL